MGAIGNALGLIVSTLGSLLIGAIIIRFLLQAARADFYNPVSQAIVKATSPFVTPLRKFIPGYKGLDIASLFAAYLIGIASTAVLTFLYFNVLPPVPALFSWPLIGLLSMVLYIYFGALIIMIISSWIAPRSAHPVLLLVYQLIAPLQSRIRRIIPPLGMIDISPIFIFLGLQALRIMLEQGLAANLGLNPLLVIGI